MSRVALDLKDQQTVQMAAAHLRRRQRGKDSAIRIGAVATILVLWEIVGRTVNPLLFASPSRIAGAAVYVVGSGELWKYMSVSLKVFAIGVSLGTLVGVIVGIAMARFRLLDLSLEPLTIALYSTPAVALVPLLVVWFGTGDKAKSVVIFFFALFPILINTYQGVKNVDPRLLEVSRSFRSTERALWFDVIIPASLPFIVAGLRLGIGRALVGMVIADLYTAVSGIGYLIVKYAQLIQMDRQFVPVVMLSLLGVTLVQVLRWLEVKVAPWQQHGRDE